MQVLSLVEYGETRLIDSFHLFKCLSSVEKHLIKSNITTNTCSTFYLYDKPVTLLISALHLPKVKLAKRPIISWG